jgi:hypothetical protein
MSGTVEYRRQTTVSHLEALVYADEYQTIYDEMTTPPDATNAGYQDTLVKALKTAGVWSLADVIYVTAIHTNGGGEAYINWKNPGTHDLTDPGSTSPTFTAYQGFTGDGTSDYLSTNYNVSDDGDNASLNSTTIAVYNRGTIPDSPTGTRVMVGGNAWPVYAYVGVSTNGEGSFDAISQCHSTDAYAIGFAVDGDGKGFFTHVRRATDDNELYKNGTSINSDTEDYDDTETAADFYILALNDSGSAVMYCGCQISFVYIGGALTDTQVSNMNTAVEAYMDSLGYGIE